jgi:hypothetical protein
MFVKHVFRCVQSKNTEYNKILNRKYSLKYVLCVCQTLKHVVNYYVFPVILKTGNLES